MPDEIVDTPTEPVIPDDPAPVEPTEPVEPVEPAVPAEPAQPAYITTDQLTAELDKRDQSHRSWMGRRDKELTTQIGGVIDERLTRQQQTQQTPEEVSMALSENPRAVIRAEIEAVTSEQNQQHQTHVTNTMTQIANLMDSDPLYGDEELGKDIVENIKKQVESGKVNAGMAPEQAGRLMLGDALASVHRTRAAQKINPLGTNVPTKDGSNLNPPAAKKKAIKHEQLDARTQRMADHYGYKPEDLARIFPVKEK